MWKQIYEVLAGMPKEYLQVIILELMRNNKITFAELAELHVKHLEGLKRGETERLMKLRSKVIDLWVGTKKELPSKLVALMQEGKDQGWANITQE